MGPAPGPARLDWSARDLIALTSFGLSALIVKVQPLFEAIRWAGVAYLACLGVLVTGLHGARRLLMRRRVRRALDAATGAVLLGFGAKLATEHG
jgi:threonine/homoserine/homoserine lactone efflux protein